VPQAQQEHWYFRLNAMMNKHGHVYEELPFFDPTLGESMTMIDPTQHRGINCRFGMKGVIAETHFDSSSNFITLMGGQRRYILAHPSQCINMELYPQEHPSGRHSSINWSTATKEFVNTDRPFVHAQVNEVVLQAGDLMYLPTHWFHFIVSLNLNYQCNSRSGEFYEYEHFMTKCGFEPPSRHKHRH
jgi:ribosomal protein L16 Arg81 hydroxylase